MRTGIDITKNCRIYLAHNKIRTDAYCSEKSSLEKRLREFEETKRLLEEEIEDAKSEREESLRNIERQSAELKTRNESLQGTVKELQQDSDRRESLLQIAQQQLTEKDTAYGALEAEVLRLKAQTGDAETLGVIKRELSEQVTHIKKLETFNRKQGAELDHFKKLNKSIEIIEEEKRSLQRKVDGMESLQNELGEARIQRQRVEDERRAWTAYLQSQAGSDGEFEFDSPESLARALVEERLQRVVVVERLGAVEAELAGKDSINQGLEGEKLALIAELEKAKLGATASDGGDAKARLRLERQKALALKEVEFLRAQLSAMDDEDTTFHAENAHEAKEQRIRELDSLVEQYRKEVETLQGELKTVEAAPQSLALAGTKRPRDDAEDSERIGTLLRKNRKMQERLDALQASSKLLETELSVANESLAAASKQLKTRVLSMRSNPTSDFEAIKLATLNALRQENADLLAQLQTGARSTMAKSVPMSTLEACQRDLQDAQAALQSQEKRADRLKRVWGDKVTEFRETVISLLGWNVVFMKNGKTKVTSEFYPAVGEDENSIEFDGDKGTMKVSGGSKSAFAQKITDQLKFWVHGKGNIPCFLAALTIEFYDEANRDKTMQM